MKCLCLQEVELEKYKWRTEQNRQKELLSKKSKKVVVVIEKRVERGAKGLLLKDPC